MLCLAWAYAFSLLVRTKPLVTKGKRSSTSRRKRNVYYKLLLLLSTKSSDRFSEIKVLPQPNNFRSDSSMMVVSGIVSGKLDRLTLSRNGLYMQHPWILRQLSLSTERHSPGVFGKVGVSLSKLSDIGQLKHEVMGKWRICIRVTSQGPCLSNAEKGSAKKARK